MITKYKFAYIAWPWLLDSWRSWNVQRRFGRKLLSPCHPKPCSTKPEVAQSQLCSNVVNVWPLKNIPEILTLSNLAKISPRSADEGFVAGLTFMITDGRVNSTLPASIFQWFDAALVVRETALRDVSTRSITLEVDHGDDRSIDRQLLVVDTKTVTVSIGVGEQTRLEDGIGRRFDIWNKMGRREGNLLWRGLKYVKTQMGRCVPAQSRQSSFAGFH